MIIHADMDAFYASVEIRDHPELAGKPVAVGGSPHSRGVISAANYVARQFGVHSALPSSTAMKRCPDLILIPGRMSVYSEVSQQIHDIFARYTPLIEPLSLDEAFLDVSASVKLFGSTTQIAQRIKQEIRDELGLVVSIGVAPNKFIAKIASDINKPDGFVVVPEDEAQRFLDPLPVTRIWGIGKSGNAVLEKHGITTIQQLRQWNADKLYQLFGKHGEHLWRLANGIDTRQVIPDHEAKSISHETTFAVDLNDIEVLKAHLLHLTEQVTWRLRHHQYQGRTVQLKIRFADFSSITRSFTLAQATNNTKVIWHAARDLLLYKLPPKHQAIRLIGVGISGIVNQGASTAPKQQDLFSANDAPQNRSTDAIDELNDNIRQRFGPHALQRGRSIQH